MLPTHPITDLYQTRPLGGVVASMSPVSCRTFRQNNGVHVDRGSNKKDTNTHRWARCHRRDFQRSCGVGRSRGNIHARRRSCGP
ncbi:hypothetical protein HBH64_003020 [Parastagonospora nodorum]|nr:hypothetical protein HBH50_025410 [Parastagonospora nodorum]KAH4096491.1 hypothetical protein HBH48_034280 [Parastagonospora nodorum]KAH4203366.1 hypothetical protein HBH42_000540 [Parastagonospora nodorum]KAH4312890.1 hypothetical protein HBI01_000560 [Parastagonospora nodorum]KAH4316313.1 hypothetical protein HBI02_038160 [Parastagonospora nodorum]